MISGTTTGICDRRRYADLEWYADDQRYRHQRYPELRRCRRRPRGDNGYGTFEMTSGTWTYTLDNNDPAVQALDVGETLTDTHTFTATDGSTQQVTVTINGAEDTPVFDSTAITAATEDVAYSYTITTSDVDVESVTITAPTLPAWLTFVDNGDGTATLSGTPTNAEVGNHNVVLNVSDGTLSSNQNFTIVVGNTNDPAVIGGADTGCGAGRRRGGGEQHQHHRHADDHRSGYGRVDLPGRRP